MKLIDKDAVMAEIEKIEADAICQYKSDKSRYAEGVLDITHRIKHFLDTLKAKDVDLDASVERYIEQHKTEFKGYFDIRRIAKHFFELGLAQKRE